jgi:hypothetical protein
MILIFFEVLSILLLLVMACILGYASGRASAKEEEKKEKESNVSNFYNSIVTEDRIKEIVAEITKPTETCNFTRDRYNKLKTLWELHEQKTETPDDEIGLTSRMSALEDRMKRIERKGGLSV